MAARTLTVSEARASLADLLEQVANGDEITLTRHGRSVAVIVRPDVLHARRVGEVHADAAELAAALDRARDAPLRDIPDIGETRAEELVRAVRGARARR